MTDSKTSKTTVQDPSVEIIQAIDQVDLKAFSFVQLRRLYTALMQTAADVDEELKVRSEKDNAGDTVRVPVPSVAE
ncbi:MAG: hypothetical protein V3R40_05175 [Gammaproteobacteria bacterium]